MLLQMLGGYRYLAMALVAVALLAGAYAKGRADGHAVEASHWQAREIAHQQRAIAEREQLQAALDARNAEIAMRDQESARVVETVRTEYLPGKVIVRRELVEKPLPVDCRVGERVRDVLNAALRGTPVAADDAAGPAPGVSAIAPDLRG